MMLRCAGAKAGRRHGAAVEHGDRACQPWPVVVRRPADQMQQKADRCFIAMNRFRVLPGAQAEFEKVWTSRDTRLRDVPGFLSFHLLRGPDRDDHTLYWSHTSWRSRADFEAWTRSEAFRLAHRDAGGNRPLYLGHPHPEGLNQRRACRGPSADSRAVIARCASALGRDPSFHRRKPCSATQNRPMRSVSLGVGDVAGHITSALMY
jgi:heme-degrading monooxygenase HmoA